MEREMKYTILMSAIILAITLFMGNLVSADTVSYQAPLIYPLDLKGPYMYESEAITTEGAITGITANWEFSGKVRLEVSANNGLNYTPVINGVPLDRGFIAGEQLRYRAFLEPQSKLRRVSLSYADAQEIRQSFGNPQLSGFQFRKAIDIAGSQDADLFNYQIEIKVGEGSLEHTGEVDVYCDKKIEADFKDIRFTCADGETALAYYLESITGAKPNRIATFWVKILQLPKKDMPLRIYLYYGDKGAENLSSPKEVFDFFDEFSEKEINSEQWEVFNELNGGTGIVNGQLKLRNSKIVSRNFKLRDGIIEFKARIEGSCGIQGIAREKKQESTYSSINQTVYSSGFPGAEHTIAVGDMVKVNIGNPILQNETYVYRIIAEGLNLNFERYNAEGGEKETELHFTDIGGLTEGHLGLKGECASENAGAVYFDWIRAREYAKEIPKVISIGKEEEANLAQFSDKYESITIPVGYDIRIINLVSKYPLNISADGGRTYSKNAQDKKYYYASLGDFAAGGQLRWQTEQAANLGQVTLNYYPGIIILISPNGGEKWPVGSLKEILWSAQEYEPAYLFKLEYSLNKGRTYKTIVNETVNTGRFYWRVPDGALSQEVLIKISDARAPQIYDISDKELSFIANK